MKIIFLDIDGVLINRESCRKGFAVVAPECVAALNNLLSRTKALIVVSSCWRVGRTRIELCDLFNNWGVTPGRILDKTPHFSFSAIRGHEIEDWLALYKRQPIESYVIIDDDLDMGELLPKLVHTTFELGLTQEHVEAALRMLGDIE